MQWLTLRHALINAMPLPREVSKNPAPFFIIGSGRNGSTLLACMLNNHSQIFIPPEQYAIPRLIFDWYYLGLKYKKDGVKLAIDFFLKNSFHWKLREFISEESLVHSDHTLQDIFFELNKREAELKEITFTYYGDKTPRNTNYIPIILRLFNNCKFIFLIREPKATISSMLKMDSSVSLDRCIYTYKNAIKAFTVLTSKNARVHLVKYEDLISTSEIEIHKILNFLEIKFEDNLWKGYEANRWILGVENNRNHENLKEPLISRNGQEEFSKEELEHLRKKLNNSIRPFHYSI